MKKNIFRKISLVLVMVLMIMPANAFGLGVIDVSETTGFTTRPMIVAGNNHSVALTHTGTVYAWGSNWRGKLGDGTNVNRPHPTRVRGLYNIIYIATGENHVLAVNQNGYVWAWGNNSYGQLGNSSIPRGEQANPTPIRVENIRNIVAVAAGGDFSMALDSAGNVYTWGANWAGQLGDGSQINRYLPQRVYANTRAISAGRSHSVVLDNNGAVWSWGFNGYGQIGIASSNRYYTTARPVSLPINTVAIATGWDHTVVMATNDTIRAWGSNNHGQISIPSSSAPLSSPQVIWSAQHGLHGPQTKVYAGGNVTAVFRRESFSTLGIATGDDSNGVLEGFRSSTWRGRDTTRPTIADMRFSISIGSTHAVGITEAGYVVAWGSGQGTGIGNSNSPVRIAGADGTGHFNLNTYVFTETPTDPPSLQPPYLHLLREAGYYRWTANRFGYSTTPIRHGFYDYHTIIHEAPHGTRVFAEYYLVNTRGNRWYRVPYIPGLGHGVFWIYSGNLTTENVALATLFERDAHVFNHDLAIFSAELSALAYGRDRDVAGLERYLPIFNDLFNDIGQPRGGRYALTLDSLPIFMELAELGFPITQIQLFNYADYTNRADYHKVAYSIAHKDIVINGEDRTLTMVIVRGTAGNSEWHSNFTIGDGTDHYGFALATRRLRSDLEAYLRDNELSARNNIIFITGHSRGAAVANLLAADLNNRPNLVLSTNLYAYTFATPATTQRADAEHPNQNIFNFVNAEDFVTFVPLGGWGFWRHGWTYAFPSPGIVSRYMFEMRYRYNVANIYRELTGTNPTFRRRGFDFPVSALYRLYTLAPTIYDFYQPVQNPLDPSIQEISPREFFWFVAEAVGGSGQSQADARVVLGALAATPPIYISGIFVPSPYDVIARFLLQETFLNLQGRNPHDESLYVAWLRAIPGYSSLMPMETTFRRFRIACPVDVRVYDSNNQLVGQIINNVVDESIYSHIPMSVNGDVKYIYANSFETYIIRIIATAEGTMTYTIEDIQFSSFEVVSYKEFANVVLYPGREFISEIVVDTPDIRLLLAQGNEIIGEIAEDGTETMFATGGQGNNVGANGYSVSQEMPAVVRHPRPEREQNIYQDDELPAEAPPVYIPETEWQPIPTLRAFPFIDVATTAWYYPYVRTVWEREIFQGTSHNQFSPGQSMTRAMFTQMLANHEGANTAGFATSRFSDVSANAWYFGAIEWAVQMGIVEGVGNSNFAPSDHITREQMAVMLYRYANVMGTQLPQNIAVEFPDQNTISYWAVSGVGAIQSARIITGRPDGNFDPRATATRAEVATLFSRFLNVTE